MNRQYSVALHKKHVTLSFINNDEIKYAHRNGKKLFFYLPCCCTGNGVWRGAISELSWGGGDHFFESSGIAKSEVRRGGGAVPSSLQTRTDLKFRFKQLFILADIISRYWFKKNCVPDLDAQLDIFHFYKYPVRLLKFQIQNSFLSYLFFTKYILFFLMHKTLINNNKN